MIENLRVLRQKHNISQQKLADIIGVSQQSINQYENHGSEPDSYILKLLADFFNTSTDYLLGYTDIDHKIEATICNELNEEEFKHMSKYKELTKKQKECVDMVIDTLLSGKDLI